MLIVNPSVEHSFIRYSRLATRSRGQPVAGYYNIKQRLFELVTGAGFCPHVAEPDKRWKQKQPVRVSLSHNVSALRQQLQLSIEELAEKTGLSVTTLTAIETGQGEIMLDDLDVLAQHLGVSIATLFE